MQGIQMLHGSRTLCQRENHSAFKVRSVATMVAVPQPKASCIASTPGYTNSSITDLRRPSFKTCGSVPSSCSPLIGSSTWEDYSYSSSSSLPEFLSCEALLGGAVAAVLMWHKRSALTAAITEVVSAVAQVILASSKAAVNGAKGLFLHILSCFKPSSPAKPYSQPVIRRRRRSSSGDSTMAVASPPSQAKADPKPLSRSSSSSAMAAASAPSQAKADPKPLSRSSSSTSSTNSGLISACYPTNEAAAEPASAVSLAAAVPLPADDAAAVQPVPAEPAAAVAEPEPAAAVAEPKPAAVLTAAVPVAEVLPAAAPAAMAAAAEPAAEAETAVELAAAAAVSSCIKLETAAEEPGFFGGSDFETAADTLEPELPAAADEPAAEEPAQPASVPAAQPAAVPAAPAAQPAAGGPVWDAAADTVFDLSNPMPGLCAAAMAYARGQAGSTRARFDAEEALFDEMVNSCEDFGVGAEEAISILQEAAAAAGTITTPSEEQVQTVRNGLAANAAAAQQAIANADAIDAALKGWDEESRGRWFEEHAHAQAGEVEFQDERLAASNEREKFEGMWESVMDDPELCEMVAALQARP